MTKEQAIDHLKADIKYWENTSVSVDHLEMAIKALEQQPSDDCVSRKELYNHCFDATIIGKSGKSITRGILLEDEIDGLPSVTPISEKTLHAEITKRLNAERIMYKAILDTQQKLKNLVSREEILDELNRLGRNAFKDDTDYDNFFAFVDGLPCETLEKPTHSICKNCKQLGVMDCGYYCKLNHWGKISKEGNYGGMGDFYCADFEKRGNKNG